jgi:hypothetical protein
MPCYRHVLYLVGDDETRAVSLFSQPRGQIRLSRGLGAKPSADLSRSEISSLSKATSESNPKSFYHLQP